LALMAIVVAEKLNLDLDVLHAVKLALFHDLQEYVAGEIDSRLVKQGVVSKEEKFKLEEKALKELIDSFNDLGEDTYDLWKEFEGGKTMEARFVKALDKLEAISHLISVGDFKDLDYTATYADEAVKDFPELIHLLKEVKSVLKKKAEKVGKRWKSEYDLV